MSPKIMAVALGKGLIDGTETTSHALLYWCEVIFATCIGCRKLGGVQNVETLLFGLRLEVGGIADASTALLARCQWASCIIHDGIFLDVLNFIHIFYFLRFIIFLDYVSEFRWRCSGRYVAM